jgi:hypothetical protein
MTTPRWMTPLVVTASLAVAAPAAADAVVDWNEIAMQTIAVAPGRPGPSSALDAATVQVAVYDAVVALEGKFKPYHVKVPNAHGSTAGAVARAAHDVLVNRVPSQAASLDAALNAYLLVNGIPADDPGVTLGAQVAAHIIALRATDGSFPATFPPFTGGTDPGEWRPTPNYLPLGNPAPGNQPMAAPWLATVTPFTLKSSSQLRPGPPPRLGSRKYAEEYDEVKALGRFDSTVRTVEQTDLAYFWSGNFLIQYNRTMRTLANTKLTHIADRARLFALVNVAMADSAIASWDSKINYNFWRPLTAIQLGDSDNNNRTEGDETWTPLINTPPYPDYTSGANNLTGSAMRALELFFGSDEMEFDVSTDVPLATTKVRHYLRFSGVADQVVVARILLGIHFRTADVVARKMGEKAAKWAFNHAFKPLRGNEAPEDGDSDSIEDHAQ